MPSAGVPGLDLGRLRFRGGPLALFVYLVLVSLYPISLQQAEWVDTTGHLLWLGVFGIFFGNLVGNGPMPRRSAVVFGGALGSVATVVLTLMAAPPADTLIRERAVRLALRVNDWITQVSRGEAAYDQTVFILVIGATVWASAFAGSFLLARERRPHDAILFSGICLVINVSLALTPLFGDLVLFTLCALVLLVRLHIVTLEERWRRERIQPLGDMSMRVLGGGVTWTVVLVLLSLLTPRVGAADTFSSALSTFEAPYHRVEAEWQRFFAGVTGPSRLRGVSFSESMRLGQVPNLSNELVFTVQADGSHFWRVITYDFYTGAGWRATEQDRLDRVVPPTAGRTRLDATFEVIVAHGNLLFGANEPVRADVPFQFTGGTANQTYSSSLRAVNRFQASGVYTVSSLVSNATKVQLRRSTRVYPDDIKARYLQLPTSLPQRVRELAQRIAGSQANAYDRAEAIEAYLRDRYRYSTNVRSAPPGRDPVDYFLFDLKDDFCEYFASAMVIMLREVGIPARLVEGYTSGQYDSTLGRYVVRAQNAHAWVEAYFPQYGWIEFEPTPSEQPFPRLDDVLPQGTGSEAAASTETTETDPGMLDELRDLFEGGDLAAVALEDGGIDFRPLLALLLALLVGIAAFWARLEWRFRGRTPVDAAWGRTRLLAAYAGVPDDPTHTPYEYADVLGRHQPAIAQDVRALAHARVLDRYAPAGVTGDAHVAALEGAARVTRT
ncbi:MAG: hypothetical protein FJ034_06095, partial [Chloroflexi bacterium]|nr:hypothetical protein [Chloroflexota bacterium]